MKIRTFIDHIHELGYVAEAQILRDASHDVLCRLYANKDSEDGKVVRPDINEPVMPFETELW